MPNITRITRNPEVMGGKPCIRGMRVSPFGEVKSQKSKVKA
ncbi:MAG: DUF433 domain-containing protein [Nostoc sp.]